MENYTKQTVKRSSIAFILLIIAIGITLACSLAERSGGGSSDPTPAESAQNSAATESNPASKEPVAKQTDIFSTFKKDEDYKTATRPKILKAGWQPARSEEGDENCAHGGEICKEYPGLEAGPSSPRGDAVFRWKKGDRIVKIYTYDNQLYNRYEFEKPVKRSKSGDDSAQNNNLPDCRKYQITDKDRLDFSEGKLVYADTDGDGTVDTITPRDYKEKGSDKSDPEVKELHWIAFDLKTSGGKAFKSFFKYNYGNNVVDYYVYALVPCNLNNDGKADLVFYSGDDTSDITIILESKEDSFKEFSRKEGGID